MFFLLFRWGSSGVLFPAQSEPICRGGVAFEVAPQAAQNTNCLSLVTGHQADAFLAQAIAHPQVQELRQRLALQGLTPNFAAAKVYSGPQCALVSVPLGTEAALYYVQTAQGTSVAAVTSRGRHKLHLHSDGSTRSLLPLSRDQVHGISRQISLSLSHRCYLAAILTVMVVWIVMRAQIYLCLFLEHRV